ncbi:MAG: glycosyltransferase family 4 protein [Anaerolineales bacterium]|nr:glycosyltransferase family 4 protein [Anaerolineales bacterium]
MINAPTARPAVCIAGPLLGANRGISPSQGEVLGGMLAGDGYPVRLTSTHAGRIPRLADTLFSLWRWRAKVDLVVVMVFSGPSFYMADLSSAMARFMNKPTVFWLHGGSLPEFGRENPARVRRVLSRGKAIVSPSHFLKQSFSELGFPIEVIPNLLAIEEYPFRLRKTAQPRILWMRAFHELYNPRLALDVFSQLQQEYPQATLTMAGQDKGQLEAVRQMAEFRGLQKLVRFPGFLDTSGKRREFSSHDIFLNTSVVDNQPVSLIEAAAFGLPIVSTSAGGIPHLLKNGETALLAQQPSAGDLCASLHKILSNPGLARKLSAGGRRLAVRFAWHNVKPLWDDLFDRVAKDTPAAVYARS